MAERSDFLLSRRSIIDRNMVEPGPSNDDLEKILRAGSVFLIMDVLLHGVSKP